MGFQTNISILNDHFDWIQKHPKEFVKAIQHGMNDGIENPLAEVWEHDRAEARGEATFNPNGRESDEERQARLHYVTVHRARHMDDTQVVLTNSNSAFEINDLAYAVEKGFLDLKSNPDTWVKMLNSYVGQLRTAARRLEEAVDKYVDDQIEDDDE